MQKKGLINITFANIRIIPVTAIWSIKTIFAFVTINAFRIVLAVLANSATIVLAGYIQRQPVFINLFIVHTGVGVSKAVAG